MLPELSTAMPSKVAWINARSMQSACAMKIAAMARQVFVPSRSNW
jgi:hypothetical protein